MEEMMKVMPVGSNQPMQKGFIPALDVYETKDAVVVETPLAGVDPKDVSVSVEKGILTISGESRKEHEVEEKNYYRKEVRSGTFYRQVPLPVAVDEDGVIASFDDGILKINCPKRGEVKSKKIDIKIGKNN
jgi:HSP20 family protein